MGLYLFVVTGLLVAGIGVSLLVLADVRGDAAWLWLGRCCCRWLRLFVRISAEVVAVTGPWRLG